MAWKAPGEGGNDKNDQPSPPNTEGASDQQGSAERDPWRAGRPRSTPDRSRPPDLDQIAASLWRSLTARRRRSGGGSSLHDKPPRKGSAWMLPGLLAGTALLVWLGAGIYVVAEGSVGVVMRQGHYYGTVLAGVHWNPSLIDRVTYVDMEKDHWLAIRNQQLTHDGNLATLHVLAVYRIASAKDYLLCAQSPERLLQNALDSAVGQVAMSHSLNDLLNGDRSALSDAIRHQLQSALASRAVGVELGDIKVDSVTVPEAVKAAADAVQQAHQQMDAAVNSATAARAQGVAQAERDARRVQEEARAYRDTAVSRARSDIAQFTAALNAYERAPNVTQDRLYLDTVQRIMSAPGMRVVSAQSGPVQVSFTPSPVPLPPSLASAPEAQGAEARPSTRAEDSAAVINGGKGNSSAGTGNKVTNGGGESRDAVRDDRDSGERRYDRSLTGGRQ